MEDYTFEIIEDVNARDIARQLAASLVGRTAVCTSFDSANPAVEAEWERLAQTHIPEEFRITNNDSGPTPPVLTNDSIENWPLSHEEIYDEWWIFDGAVPAAFSVKALCNYNVTDYEAVAFTCPLEDYLKKFRPVAVFGNASDFGYLIQRRAE